MGVSGQRYYDPKCGRFVGRGSDRSRASGEGRTAALRPIGFGALLTGLIIMVGFALVFALAGRVITAAFTPATNIDLNFGTDLAPNALFKYRLAFLATNAAATTSESSFFVQGGTLANIRPGDDLDGDGISNYNEYLTGTYAFDPTDGFFLPLECGMMATIKFVKGQASTSVVRPAGEPAARPRARSCGIIRRRVRYRARRLFSRSSPCASITSIAAPCARTAVA